MAAAPFSPSRGRRQDARSAVRPIRTRGFGERSGGGRAGGAYRRGVLDGSVETSVPIIIDRHGTPESVAAQLQEYVEVGVRWVGVHDVLPFVLEPGDAAAALPRSLEVPAAQVGRSGPGSPNTVKFDISVTSTRCDGC